VRYNEKCQTRPDQAESRSYFLRPHSIYAPELHIYGDATGSSRKTSASRTDWQIVDNFFNHQFCKISRKVSSSNPPVKDRVNCVNAMLCNQAGQRRLQIDPRCKQLIQDLERVHWRSDVNGNTLTEFDKSDPARSHVSDALGYMIAREFGMQGKFGEMPFSPR
jgi:hypothetical protein